MSLANTPISDRRSALRTIAVAGALGGTGAGRPIAVTVTPAVTEIVATEITRTPVARMETAGTTAGIAERTETWRRSEIWLESVLRCVKANSGKNEATRPDRVVLRVRSPVTRRALLRRTSLSNLNLGHLSPELLNRGISSLASRRHGEIRKAQPLAEHAAHVEELGAVSRVKVTLAKVAKAESQIDALRGEPRTRGMIGEISVPRIPTMMNSLS